VSKWFVDLESVSQFANVLHLADQFKDASDVLEYLENPHEWDEEHKAWIEVNEPDNEEDEGWKEFYDWLNNQEETEDEDK
jgi:hypothetical protein